MLRPVAIVGIGTVALLVQCAGTPTWGAQFTHPTLGYTLTYSEGWICDTEAVQHGADGPVFMNFPRERLVNGGGLPEDAARIFVQVSPPYSVNFPRDADEYVRLREMARREGGVDIKAAREPDSVVRVRFTETWEAGTFKQDWTARRHNGRLFVFMLEYYADDPKGSSYERDLADIVSSISVSAATPGPIPTARERQ